MDVTVGTFNLNNLFTRWNFQASIPPNTQLTEVTELTEDIDVRFRRYLGKVVHGKDADDTGAIAARALAINVDVLAVQEVENIEALKTFNREHLGGLYEHAVLIEGNDPRLIDVGVLSKLPLRHIGSHQTEPDPEVPGQPVFGRDLLQVDVLWPSRRRRLFRMFNTHLKSNYVDFREPDPDAARQRSNERRRRQCVAMSEIIERETRSNSRFVVLGDMNDDPDSSFMSPLTDGPLGLIDALDDLSETRPSKKEQVGPQPGPRWTSRHKPTGLAPEHRLFDQIWASPVLDGHVGAAMVDRRTKHSGDGSDHDPVWVTLTDL